VRNVGTYLPLLREVVVEQNLEHNRVSDSTLVRRRIKTIRRNEKQVKLCVNARQKLLGVKYLLVLHLLQQHSFNHAYREVSLLIYDGETFPS